MLAPKLLFGESTSFRIVKPRAYVRIANKTSKDGRWKVGKKNEVVYGRKELSLREHSAAIAALNAIAA